MALKIWRGVRKIHWPWESHSGRECHPYLKKRQSLPPHCGLLPPGKTLWFQFTSWQQSSQGYNRERKQVLRIPWWLGSHPTGSAPTVSPELASVWASLHGSGLPPGFCLLYTQLKFYLLQEAISDPPDLEVVPQSTAALHRQDPAGPSLLKEGSVDSLSLDPTPASHSLLTLTHFSTKGCLDEETTYKERCPVEVSLENMSKS